MIHGVGSRCKLPWAPSNGCFSLCFIYCFIYSFFVCIFERFTFRVLSARSRLSVVGDERKKKGVRERTREDCMIFYPSLLEF